MSRWKRLREGPGALVTGPVGTAQFAAIGTTMTVVTADPAALESALTLVRTRVDQLDRAASRFRPDSELMAVQRARGKPMAVSETLYLALREAIDAAEETSGLLDPSVGEALEHCGYDRDFSEVAPNGPALTARFRRVPGWRGMRLDPSRQTASIPVNVKIDLGATAKAGCADRAASEAARAVGSGVLVNLGGDIAVAGEAPPEGWIVRIADRHDASPGDPGVTLAIRAGGLATSGTAARRWQRGGAMMHHVIDPATGRPASPCWRTVTVAAPSCLSANVASTASVILGPHAPAWLAQRGRHARLVAESGTVVGVGRWPVDAIEPEAAHTQREADRVG